MWIVLPESYGVLEGEEYDDEGVDGVEGDGDEGRPVGLAALRLHRLQPKLFQPGVIGCAI